MGESRGRGTTAPFARSVLRLERTRVHYYVCRTGVSVRDMLMHKHIHLVDLEKIDIHGFGLCQIHDDEG